MAGHSQFKNIMHRKNAQDSKRAKTFGKFLREISVAIQDGGSRDITVNAALRAAVARAKQANVPNANIDRALKGNTNIERVYESVRYDGFGPGGSALIVDVITDNRNRSACDVRNIFYKNGGRIADSNSVSFMFERKGMIIYDLASIDSDAFILHALDLGIEDVEEEDQSYILFCILEKLHQISIDLEQHFGAAKEVQAVWWPHEWITLANSDDYDALEKLRSALDQYDDVQHVWDNVI